MSNEKGTAVKVVTSDMALPQASRYLDALFAEILARPERGRKKRTW